MMIRKWKGGSKNSFRSNWFTDLINRYQTALEEQNAIYLEVQANPDLFIVGPDGTYYAKPKYGEEPLRVRPVNGEGQYTLDEVVASTPADSDLMIRPFGYDRNQNRTFAGEYVPFDAMDTQYIGRNENNELMYMLPGITVETVPGDPERLSWVYKNPNFAEIVRRTETENRKAEQEKARRRRRVPGEMKPLD